MDRRQRDGLYDRGQGRARRFGNLVAQWRDEPGSPSDRDAAGAITAYTRHTYTPRELRRIVDGESGIAHLAQDEGLLIEAFLAAYGKTSIEDRARAYKAVGLTPADMTEAGLLLGMIASKRRAS